MMINRLRTILSLSMLACYAAFAGTATAESGAGFYLLGSKGPTVGWNFKVGELPLSTRLKYYHEFDARNRAEGDAVFATLSMPLAIFAPAK